MRRFLVSLALVGCAGQPREPETRPPSTPTVATPSPVLESAPSPASSAAEGTESHVCNGTATPEPCKNDVLRKGGFQEVPPCLRFLPPVATGKTEAPSFAAAFQRRSPQLFDCVAGRGVDTSQLGKVMTARVVARPGQRPDASFVSSDLSPASKKCTEAVVRATIWPSGDGEVTLPFVLVTRVWVDDPAGACPPR